MRELEFNTRRSKVPILVLLVAGLTAGGAWEFTAHMDGASAVAIPDAPVEVEAPSAEKDLSAEPTFTPFTIPPTILNRGEVVAALEAEYPPLLRDAAVGGTARIYFFIDAEGTVVDTRLDVSSGHPALDAAAMSVAHVYRFSPAINRGDPVPVWVSFGITFQVR